MDPIALIEPTLEAAIATGNHDDCPPRFAQSLHYAVFPGGARIRPKLSLAVAKACATDDPALSAAAAASVELIHCASLVHDDLPCFDDAATRRGKPSLHMAFEERLAVLCGDALIVLAYETLAKAASNAPQRLGAMVLALSKGVGAPTGIAAGQAWECEDSPVLARYQRQKTGALFVAATQIGAASAGADVSGWAGLGQGLGEAYQVVDDILDVTADPDEIGKPVGKDSDLSRPNSVLERGMRESERHLENLLAEAAASIPACPGELELREQIRLESQHFMDMALLRTAAA
ncbi:MAG: polyprenyl synthetase family protein [Gammaproteobacteria bacterium]